MQWLSNSDRARVIDSEISNLSADLLARIPSFSCQRYQLELPRAGVDALKPGISHKKLAALTEMGRPENLELLQDLGELSAAKQIADKQFPAVFDLPTLPIADGSLRAYRPPPSLRKHGSGHSHRTFRESRR